jgi:hypothetical protein
MTVFWVVAPCSLLEIDRRLRGRPDNGGSKHLRNVSQILRDYTVQHPEDSLSIPLMMKAATTSETSVYLYQTTRRDIPEDSLHKL